MKKKRHDSKHVVFSSDLSAISRNPYCMDYQSSTYITKAFLEQFCVEAWELSDIVLVITFNYILVRQFTPKSYSIFLCPSIIHLGLGDLL